MLATGCSTHLTSVERTEKDGTRSTLTCPQLVVDYGNGMGGVDVHDQLHLHRYSIQKCISLQKHYKQLFLRFVDMTMENGYIIHRATMKKKGELPPTHADYLKRLHNQLLALQTIHLETHMNAEELVVGPIPHRLHKLGNTDDFTRQARRENGANICASFFCEECSELFGGRVPLCDNIRCKDRGNTHTCYEVWHRAWNYGKGIPLDLKKKIRFCKRKHNVQEEE
ncbi:hypothetical protein PHMEG_0002211 [Phytophthora megakarya]|uniref:PiggyBac transposable element-derived protein domain-containing protein n=1 Tax=Phytophthora megakarya TaxID=4795 RepID=A0A225WZY2_9STRA|nr:hypothetical protein PHMEG_0002211 [Phytophthora megakarya]